MQSTGVIGFQIWSDAIVKFKNEILHLPLGKKDNLVFPLVINSRRLFFSFLKGLFDTDGSLYYENKRGKPYPRIDIKTISKNLCFKVTELLNTYGIRATTYEYNRVQNGWNNLFSVIIHGWESILLWKEKIGSNNPKHIKKFNLVESNGKIDGSAEI